MKHASFPRVLPILASGLIGGVCAAAPEPPQRPAEFGRATAAPDTSTPTAAAPNACASPSCPAAGGREPVDVDMDSLKPYNLPPASRAKMRACGEQWRDLKLAGNATGLTWRTFAEKCLVE